MPLSFKQMYDRLPLNIIDYKNRDTTCKGRCYILSSKDAQVLGLALGETDTHYIIGYPSRCCVGETETGEDEYVVVPYTRLPYLVVPKATTLSIPLHAESEYSFYEYVVNNLSENRDFKKLLTEHGFDHQESADYYLQRHFKVRKFCEKEKADERKAEISTPSGEKIIH